MSSTSRLRNTLGVSTRSRSRQMHFFILHQDCYLHMIMQKDFLDHVVERTCGPQMHRWMASQLEKIFGATNHLRDRYRGEVIPIQMKFRKRRSPCAHIQNRLRRRLQRRRNPQVETVTCRPSSTSSLERRLGRLPLRRGSNRLDATKGPQVRQAQESPNEKERPNENRLHLAQFLRTCIFALYRLVAFMQWSVSAPCCQRCAHSAQKKCCYAAYELGGCWYV